MNTAQLAIVASTVTAVGVTALSSWVHIRTNKDSLDAQRKLAMQARVATTYEDMFELVNHTMDTVEATKPILVMDGTPVPPEPIDQDRIRKIQARIGVHGSPESKEILERWSKGCGAFYQEAWRLNEMQGAQQRGMRPSEIKENWGGFVTDAWRELQAKRLALHAVVAELEGAVNAEMRA